MFTWIQRYFQKHFGIIFVLILLSMAVPLIMVFTPSSGIGQGERHVTSREVFGYNLASQEDQGRLFGDANLSATLQLGYSGLSNEQLQQYALQRAAALQLANQLHLPTSTKAEVTEHIKHLPIFAAQDGSFDAQRYDSFRASLKSGGRVSEADVSRIISEDVRADKARDLLAGPGYVLDDDVTTQLKRMHSLWTLGLATINYDAFKPAIEPTSAQLSQFFSENNFRYEIPPRISASYVAYPLTAYLAQATVTDQEAHALFDAAPGHFQKPAADGKVAAPAGSDDFELVRTQVESAVRLTKARRLATKDASDLALALYEGKISHDPTVLDSFLAAHQVKLLPLQPFTQETGPAELGLSPEIAAAAFKLNAERFYSDALPTAEGAVVLFWRDTLPSRMPLLNEVADKVRADYIENEKRKQFVGLGRQAKAQLETKTHAGVDFVTAAGQVASSLGVAIEAKQLEPFSLANPLADSTFTAYNVLESLGQGQVSDMTISRDKGELVYVATRQLPDLTPANPQYAEVRAQIAAITGRMSASRMLSEMVETELRRTEPKP